MPDPVKQVDIIPLGRARLFVSTGEAWNSWFDAEGTSDDLMDNRDRLLPLNKQPFDLIEFCTPLLQQSWANKYKDPVELDTGKKSAQYHGVMNIRPLGNIHCGQE